MVAKLSGFSKFDVDMKMSCDHFIILLNNLCMAEGTGSSEEKLSELLETMSKAFVEGNPPYAGDLENETYKAILQAIRDINASEMNKWENKWLDRINTVADSLSQFNSKIKSKLILFASLKNLFKEDSSVVWLESALECDRLSEKNKDDLILAFLRNVDVRGSVNTCVLRRALSVLGSRVGLLKDAALATGCLD